MNKYTDFIELSTEISQCHLCKQMFTKPNSVCGEYLENDSHGLDTAQPYVNLWNLWHGNLDAEIMVIGQDFGQKQEALSFLNKQKSKDYTNPTDKALRELFKSSFGIDVDDENAPLFFTNMANCYRKHKTTGGMHAGWLPICANKFMARLIRIVRPKIIIVLGQAAFEAMFCLDGLKLECTNPKGTARDTFKEIIQYDYQLKLFDENIRVFPVFHPGANSNRNRTEIEQKQDWKVIADYYKGNKI